MERDIIKEIHELTKLSLTPETNELANELAEDLAKDFPLIDEDAWLSKQVRVQPDTKATPAQPEHFEAISVPEVVQYEHKVRIGANWRNGSFSPILREKK